MKHTAIIGGGLSGLTAAWQLHQLGRPFTLYEATPRLGGTIRTVHRDGFTIELGPDGWVTEKPWAAQLARDLGLAHELISSNDATRVTWIVRDNRLVPMPNGMRMMVPTNLEALSNSLLFSAEAIAAYAAEPARAAELRTAAPDTDESIASFVLRHFGNEVLTAVAAPLLSGVFGGDVRTLSVRAVMPRFVEMERTHGSLITALQSRTPRPGTAPSIFITLTTGLETLIHRMTATLPPESIHRNTPIQEIRQHNDQWEITSSRGVILSAAKNLRSSLEAPQNSHGEIYDYLILATPAHITRTLLAPHSPRAADILALEATSAVIVAFAFDSSNPFELPQGFGFLVPFTEPSPLLACTFTDQKFPHRAPPGHRLLRAFFGGENAPHIAALPDEQIATLALAELQKILGPLPTPTFSLVQRWPLSLPQYAVGHLDRTAELMRLLPPNLHLLGNAYNGLGLPDLIRDARALAHQLNR